MIGAVGLAALLAGVEPAPACDGFACVGVAIARAHDAVYALTSTGRVLKEGAYGLGKSVQKGVQATGHAKPALEPADWPANDREKLTSFVRVRGNPAFELAGRSKPGVLARLRRVSPELLPHETGAVRRLLHVRLRAGNCDVAAAVLVLVNVAGRRRISGDALDGRSRRRLGR